MAALLLSALLAAAPAGAVGFQDTIALDRAVIAFTGKAIGEEGGARAPVDARLKLKPCATLSMAWRAEKQDSVVVTCTGPEWRIFVPIRMAAPPTAPRAAPAARRRAENIARHQAWRSGDDRCRIARLLDHPRGDRDGRRRTRRALPRQGRGQQESRPGGRHRGGPRDAARLGGIIS